VIETVKKQKAALFGRAVCTGVLVNGGTGHVTLLSQADRQFLDRAVHTRTRLKTVSDTGNLVSEKPINRASWLDFTTLPGWNEQRILRSAASAIGLRDPYFLVHEGDAGASTVVDGRKMHNFSSYDYLGFNQHPAVRAAAQTAIDRYGVSASASRLVAGERPVHRALEAALADHYHQEDCLTFVSGHATNVATIVALLGPKDLVLHDALAHNSIVMGAQMARAERRSFPHNDLATLESTLVSLRGQFERVLIVAEGHYSMDGDVCDLAALVALKERHHAWLMIDDAHGLGVLGATGLGIFEHCNVDPRKVDIWMGTLSKTLAGCGGYIAGPTSLIDYLKRSAGGFVYSVAMPPAVTAASLEALQLLTQEPERIRKLHANARFFRKSAVAAGLDVGLSIGMAIVPVMTGSSIRAVTLSQRLFDRGVNVQPIIHPAIPERLARLRFFLSSEHTFAQIEEVVPMIAEELKIASRSSLTGLVQRNETV
jgi:8-amino-7-oxononanoate synthase